MSDINKELPGMLLDNLLLMKQFNKDSYKTAFADYYEKYEPLFSEINAEYEAASDKEDYVEDLAVAFIDRAKEIENSLVKKRDKDSFIVEHNSVLTVYVLPALVRSEKEPMRELANAIVSKWNEAFDRYRVSIGTFEEIDGGFKRKLCYITTAVCESLGKPDDCYELRMLREYRDEYLLRDECGRSIVDTYYNIAPTIVNRINKKEDRREIYRNIFNEYINPCISYIEGNEPEKCKELYSDMVYSLRDEYMYSVNNNN